MTETSIEYGIWQEKMDSLLLERKEINKKINAWKSTRKGFLGSSIQPDIRRALSACQTRIMAILSDSEGGLTIEEIKRELVNHNYMYSDETVRTELSRLKDFQVKYDKTDNRYYHILSKNVKADNLPEAIVNVFVTSNTPLSVSGVFNALVGMKYDLSVYQQPKRKISAIVFRLKNKNKIDLSHKEGRTGYYTKNGHTGTRDSHVAITQNL